jgi:hypothetical protein
MQRQDPKEEYQESRQMVMDVSLRRGGVAQRKEQNNNT